MPDPPILHNVELHSELQQLRPQSREHVFFNLRKLRQTPISSIYSLRTIDILALFRVAMVEILRIIGGKNHSLLLDDLQRAAQRDRAAFEPRHVEIELVEIIVERLGQLEAIGRSRNSFFVSCQTAAKVRKHEAKLRIAFNNAARDQARYRNTEIELPRKNPREHVVFHQLVTLRSQRGMDGRLAHQVF